MKKILILTNHSYMLYRFRRELIQELMKNAEVVLSMPFVGHEDDFRAMGLRCIETEINRRGMNPVQDSKLFFFYQKLLRREKPDLVITYSIKPNIYGGMACTLAGVDYCVNVQGLGTAFQRHGVSEMVTALYRMALHRAKVVFFENGGNAREFVDRRIIRQEKVCLLPGAGINLREYPVQPYPDHDRFHFLYLGRIMEEKGVSEMFAAMRRLRESVGDGAVLDLVGFYEDDYHRQIDALKQEGIAIGHGFQNEPRPYYAEADCVILASYHEGMSNVLLEAAAMGRPVICSDIPGCREAVDADRTGLLCRVRDTDSLYTQMLRMVRLSREDREQMGLAARAKMEREFDRDEVVRRTVEALFR